MKEPEVSYRWVECLASIPSAGGAAPTDIQCPAKVSCADIVDALGLGRWEAMAFISLWDSAKGSPRSRAEALAGVRWFVDRQLASDGWQVLLRNVVAALLEGAATEDGRAESNLLMWSRRLRDGSPDALLALEEAYRHEISRGT